MSTIRNITINILLQTLPIPQKGFGMPLILGSGAAAIAYQEFTSETDMLTAGYANTDPEYLMAQKMFSQEIRPEKVAVYRRDTAAETITQALDNLVLAGKNDWYALLIVERATASIHEAADWVASKEKLFIGGTTLITDLSGRSGIREAYMVHKSADTDYPDAAWAGRCLPTTPGSITWAFKKLNGQVESGFNTTETDAILTASGNYLGAYGGAVASYNGKTSGGEWIDVIRSRDYIKARMQEALTRLLLLHDKIPYTVQGFGLVASEIRGVLTDAGNKGIIATVDTEEDTARSDNGKYQYIVTVPASLDEIPANDRANRKFAVTFTFRLGGAIHEIDITGSITA